MAYLESENVRVFPAPNRDAKYTSAYLLSEKNLGDIIRSLYKRNNSSFVSEVTYNDQTGTISAIFVLYGFYFEVINGWSGIGNDSTANDAWASIYVKKTGSENTEALRLVDENGNEVIDDNNRFLSLNLTFTKPAKESLPDGVTRYSLHVYENAYSNDHGEHEGIPEASKMKWNADTLNQSISFDNNTLVINTNPDNYQ